jgi:hypothetical protein
VRGCTRHLPQKWSRHAGCWPARVRLTTSFVLALTLGTSQACSNNDGAASDSRAACESESVGGSCVAPPGACVTGESIEDSQNLYSCKLGSVCCVPLEKAGSCGPVGCIAGYTCDRDAERLCSVTKQAPNCGAIACTGECTCTDPATSHCDCPDCKRSPTWDEYCYQPIPVAHYCLSAANGAPGAGCKYQSTGSFWCCPS